MDIYFSSPDLCIDLKKQKISCYCTVRLNHKGMPDDFRGKIQKLKLNNVRGLLEKYPTFGREKETGLLGALDT